MNRQMWLMSCSALVYAAIYQGAEEVTALLDQQGVDINAKDENGKTALLHAFTSRRWEQPANQLGH